MAGFIQEGLYFMLIGSSAPSIIGFFLTNSNKWRRGTKISVRF